MKMQYGIYDFFAYMLPGAIYLIILIWAADIFTTWQAPWAVSMKLSATQILIGGAVSYTLGVLLSPLSYNPLYVLLRKKEPIEAAFERVGRTYPNIELNFTSDQWPVLDAAIRLANPGLAETIDKHRATHLMLRSMSFALLVLAILHVVDSVLSKVGYLNYLLGLVPTLLSIRAARDSAKFAEWSYSLVFEATIARAMDCSKLVTQRDSNLLPEEGKNNEISPNKAN